MNNLLYSLVCSGERTETGKLIWSLCNKTSRPRLVGVGNGSMKGNKANLHCWTSNVTRLFLSFHQTFIEAPWFRYIRTWGNRLIREKKHMYESDTSSLQKLTTKETYRLYLAYSRFSCWTMLHVWSTLNSFGILTQKNLGKIHFNSTPLKAGVWGRPLEGIGLCIFVICMTIRLMRSCLNNKLMPYGREYSLSNCRYWTKIAQPISATAMHSGMVNPSHLIHHSPIIGCLTRLYTLAFLYLSKFEEKICWVIENVGRIVVNQGDPSGPLVQKIIPRSSLIN